jgi:hypothetical protein
MGSHLPLLSVLLAASVAAEKMQVGSAITAASPLTGSVGWQRHHSAAAYAPYVMQRFCNATFYASSPKTESIPSQPWYSPHSFLAAACASEPRDCLADNESAVAQEAAMIAWYWATIAPEN